MPRKVKPVALTPLFAVSREFLDPSDIPPGSVAVAPGPRSACAWIVWPDGSVGTTPLGFDYGTPRHTSPAKGHYHPAQQWSSGPWQVIVAGLSEAECDAVANATHWPGERGTFADMLGAALQLAFARAK